MSESRPGWLKWRKAACRSRTSRITLIFNDDWVEGQDCLLGCATVKERDLLASSTGLKVDWLR